MKFDHTVKYKGEYYPAGAEVPMQESRTATDNPQKEVARKTTRTNKE